MKRNVLTHTIVFLAAAALASAGTYTIDQAHSDVSFKVRQLVSKTVVLPVTFLGEVAGPRGGKVAGWEIETTLDRKDFGIVWNRALDAVGMILGDEVQITINFETKKQ